MGDLSVVAVLNSFTPGPLFEAFVNCIRQVRTCSFDNARDVANSPGASGIVVTKAPRLSWDQYSIDVSVCFVIDNATDFIYERFRGDATRSAEHYPIAFARSN